MKRSFDLAFAIFWIALTGPLQVLIAILVRLDSAGPSLYSPAMLGWHGRTFHLRRFRTLRADSSGCLTAAERLTPVGRFIRNYSLDHLPMLWNLLASDLTLIGPRPMEVGVVDLRDPVWQQYLAVKPGIVNYAVLKLGRTYGHSDAPNLALKRALELEYVRRRSPQQDLRLIRKSIVAFLTSRGNVKARGNPDNSGPLPGA